MSFQSWQHKSAVLSPSLATHTYPEALELRVNNSVYKLGHMEEAWPIFYSVAWTLYKAGPFRCLLPLPSAQ